MTGCVSKKYGRYFHNRTTAYSDYKAPDLSKDSTAQASLEVRRVEKVSQPSNMAPRSSVSTVVEEAKYYSTSAHVLDSLVQDPVKDEVEPKEAESSVPVAQPKNDPMGIIGLGLVVLGTLITWHNLRSDDNTDVFSPQLIIAGGILGKISLNRIKKNPVRWKGKGFGLAAWLFMLLMAVLLVLLVVLIISIAPSLR